MGPYVEALCWIGVVGAAGYLVYFHIWIRRQ